MLPIHSDASTSPSLLLSCMQVIIRQLVHDRSYLQHARCTFRAACLLAIFGCLQISEEDASSTIGPHQSQQSMEDCLHHQRKHKSARRATETAEQREIWLRKSMELFLFKRSPHSQRMLPTFSKKDTTVGSSLLHGKLISFSEKGPLFPSELKVPSFSQKGLLLPWEGDLSIRRSPQKGPVLSQRKVPPSLNQELMSHCRRGGGASNCVQQHRTTVAFLDNRTCPYKAHWVIPLRYC